MENSTEVYLFFWFSVVILYITQVSKYTGTNAVQQITQKDPAKQESNNKPSSDY